MVGDRHPARTRGARAVLIAWATLSLTLASPDAVGAEGDEPPATPIQLEAAGDHGEGRIETPGRTCADGGDGAYWNYDYATPIDAGAFSQQPGDLRLHLALHSDSVRFPNTEVPVLAEGPQAFLQGTDSHATLANARGTVKLALRSGECDDPTLAFDGIHAAGGGTWEVEAGDGSYRGATGSGTFTVAADVAPGADNPFSLALDGDVAVLQPELQVEVLGTYWGSLGTDYLSRRVTVVYRITNVGSGDAFDAKVASITSSTPGVTPIGGTDLPLGDLPAGDSEVVQLRFQLGLLGPCQLVILNCHFSTDTEVSWADALDVPRPSSATSSATAPALPPPL